MDAKEPVTGPDFTKGIFEELIKDGETLLGHVGDKAVLMVREDGEIYAVGAKCTHYGAPLGDGLITGTHIHCPWHHSCFSLKTGEAVRAPALNPIPCWHTEIRDGKIYVTDRKHLTIEPRKGTETEKFVIVGGGAAGTAAATMLRHQGFAGSIHLISADESAPYDRPNLSKQYLQGNAPEDWLPLRTSEYYQKHNINLELNVAAEKIDPHRQHLILSDGRTLKYDRCLLATGGAPVLPPIPGIERDNVYTLRTLKDCRRIIDRSEWAKKVVIIGAGFIGLEVAASLRMRNLEVHVVAPEELPLLKVLGIHAASYLKRLHEQHGVKFHLGHSIEEIRERSVVLDDHDSLECDMVIIGAGIKPNVSLARQAGCEIQNGVLVDHYLETSVPGVFAAGDIARWPDPHSHRPIRVEHWEVAQRQGQVAALNMLGDRVRFQEVPFFWTEHYDLTLTYVGYSDRFDRMDLLGDVESKNFAVAFYEDEHLAAFLAVGRDKESLMIEDVLSHTDVKLAQEVLRNYERMAQRKKPEPPNYFEPAP